jgi:arsenite methyltransferase
MELKDVVKEKYGQAALRVATGGSSCCGASCALDGCDPITSNLYDSDQMTGMPEEAVKASLGCGNPTALAELNPGETVLDLGSGGGIDVLLSAKRVGPTGKAYGLDMTDEMLALARENQRKAGIENVEFLKGEMESIPLPDNSVDVIISNCVINLAADKDRVLGEAFRVLKPGGRFAVSDVVVRGEVPAGIRRSMELWVGCIAGALEEHDYVRALAQAGFDLIHIEPTRVYNIDDARQFLNGEGVDVEAIAPEVEGKFVSAFIRAVKPYPKKRILILCTGNASRSPMAEGLLRHDAGDRFEVFSAGTRLSQIRPEAIAVLREVGIDISGHRPKHVDEFAGQRFDYVLTICDNAKESCPIFPGGAVSIHQNFEDPVAPGSEAERMALFRKVRDEIRNYLRTFANVVLEPTRASQNE